MASALAAALLDYTERQGGESPYRTPVETLGIMRSDRPKPPAHILLRPALCIVAQGAKWATFGERRLVYKAGQALVVGVETPSVGQVVEASPGEPCLVLMFELDLDIMRSVAESLPTLPRANGESGHGVFVADFDGPLMECAIRLVKLLDRPAAIPALYPGLMREICYWLLAGPQGGDVVRLALGQGPSQRVMQAMRVLRKRFRETVRIEELASAAQTSVTSFHRQFKALTQVTPLQYQKQLRLLEARRLMITGAVTAEAAAFAVGYESASQFSREYVRMFGVPPKRDALHMKTALQDEMAA